MINRRMFMSMLPMAVVGLDTLHAATRNNIQVHHGSICAYPADPFRFKSIYIRLDSPAAQSGFRDAVLAFEEDLMTIWGKERIGEKVELIVHQNGYDVRFVGNKLNQKSGAEEPLKPTKAASPPGR